MINPGIFSIPLNRPHPAVIAPPAGARDDEFTPFSPDERDLELAQSLQHPSLGRPSQRWEYRNACGALEGYQCRFDTVAPDGSSSKEFRPLRFGSLASRLGWHWKGWGDARPLYRLHELNGMRDARVLVVEGEKAADRAAERFPELTTTTAMNGAQSPRRTDWSALRGRDVLIWPDNDDPGRSFAYEVARCATEAGARSVGIVTLPLGLPPKWDLGDDLPDGLSDLDLQDALAEAVATAEIQSDPANEESLGALGKDGAADLVAKNFRCTENGVFYRDPDPDKEDLLICGPLEFVAETRDAAHGNWGLLLKWRDHDGHEHEWAMPRSLLSGDGNEVRAYLMAGGLYIAPGKKARDLLLTYLLSARTDKRARCVQRMGWHDGVFVLPDATIGDAAGERTLLQTGTRFEHSYNCSGTLSDWQRDIARYAVGNSRLVLAIASAFAGPLLHGTVSESGGFHFRGQSSTGKSTALSVAGSVWGGGGQKGYLVQWRATDNGLEAVAARHSDTLLCLDELSQVDAKAAKQAAYLLANGSGKSRAGRGGEARPPVEFRILFLSSGEISLGDKIAEDGRGGRAAAGQQVRIVDIAADAGANMGMFESLHGYPDAEKLSSHLKKAASKTYGSPARIFLEKLCSSPDEYVRAVLCCRDEFVAENCPAGADGQVYRVAARFGLAAAAGELARAFGILPWPDGEAVRGAAQCFKSWLDARHGIGPAELEDGVRNVMAFIEAHGSSRFEPFEEVDVHAGLRTNNRVGWRKKDKDGTWQYYATSDGLREMAPGPDLQALRRALVARGVLIASSPGGAAKPVRVPGHGVKKLYHLVGIPSIPGGSDA